MIVALAGGVGGAKLAHGLYQLVQPHTLAVIVNTADDFNLFGLRISPDADTVMYTLAGVANPATGWGVAGDTWNTLEMLTRYGYEPWFRLGDRDFATHIARSEQLGAGRSLTDVTQTLSGALGVHAQLLPMCDEPVATQVDTPSGQLPFQDYFVRRHHQDPVTGVSFTGIENATMTKAAAAAIERATLIIICPSNPIVSIGPILAVAGYRDALGRSKAPKVAVSPIVGGKALRGPADQMLAGLGHEVSAFGVAQMYRGLIDGLVIDEADADQQARISALGIRVLVTNTVMNDEADRVQLARETVAFGQAQLNAGNQQAGRSQLDITSQRP